MASLNGVYSVIDGVRYNAEDFLNPDEVQTVETGDGVTVVTMVDGNEYFFSASSLKRREPGDTQIPRPFTPNNGGIPEEKEKKSMANLTIARVDSKNPATRGALNQSLAETFQSDYLKEWAEGAEIADDASIEEVMEMVRGLPGLTDADKVMLEDWDGYMAQNRGSNAGGGAPAGDAPFEGSSHFNDGAAGGGAPPKQKAERRRLSADELKAQYEEHRNELAALEGERTDEETRFIETLKGYLIPYGFLPVLTPVTRNNGRLSAKLVNRIPASKRTFAPGVPEDVKASIESNNIPAHLAQAEYDIVYFESNPGPLLGVLAYLPRNFKADVLESLSTAPSKSKIESWARADQTAKDIELRWVSKEELLLILIATAAPAKLVEEKDIKVPSPKNLEFFFKRMFEIGTENTWYNLISRDSATGKARKGTSAGYLPLNTFVQEAPRGDAIQMVSNQMLGGPLFNAPKPGKAINNRYEELSDAGRAQVRNNTRETFQLTAIASGAAVNDVIAHENRKDAPLTKKMLPAKVERYTTSTGVDRTRFVKENFLKVLESPTKNAFDQNYTKLVQQHALLLQEAQKRRAKASQTSMREQTNILAATNDMLQGRAIHLGKKKK